MGIISKKMNSYDNQILDKIKKIYSSKNGFKILHFLCMGSEIGFRNDCVKLLATAGCVK